MERVLMYRWDGEEDWEEYEDGELNLEEWELGEVYKIEYKVVYKEKES